MAQPGGIWNLGSRFFIIATFEDCKEPNYIWMTVFGLVPHEKCILCYLCMKHKSKVYDNISIRNSVMKNVFPKDPTKTAQFISTHATAVHILMAFGWMFLTPGHAQSCPGPGNSRSRNSSFLKNGITPQLQSALLTLKHLQDCPYNPTMGYPPYPHSKSRNFFFAMIPLDVK